MFFFWWRAGSEKLLDVMEVTVCWQQSDSWQKRREKRVWHQQRDWQKWNWVHLTVAAYAYRPLTRHDSSPCPFADPPSSFLPSLWPQRLGVICIVKKKRTIALLIEGLTYDVGWNYRIKLIYYEAISAHLSLNIPRRWFLLWHRPFTLHLLVLNNKMLSLWMTSEQYLPLWVCARVVWVPCSKRYRTDVSSAPILNFCNVYVTFKVVGE